jgi:hypothetical protein
VSQKWWACECCEDQDACSYAVNETHVGIGDLEASGPSVTWDNGDPEPDNPCNVGPCNVALFSMDFSSNAVKEEFLGVDDPEFPWVLFKSGDTWARADGRPIPVTVTTSTFDYVGPTDTLRRFYVPTEIDLDSGAFTWERGAPAPIYDDGIHWGDFDEMYLSSPVDPPKSGMPTEGVPRCVKIEFSVFSTGFVWPTATPPGIRLEFNNESEDGCCPEYATEICLEHTGVLFDVGPYDGWTFNGLWYGELVIDCGEGDVTITAQIIWSTGSDANECLFGEITSFAGDWTYHCAEARTDVRELPTADVWISTLPDDCDSELTAIDFAECGDDCDGSFCLYVWNEAGEVWELFSSVNCGPPCPETPDDTTPPEEGDPLFRTDCCEPPAEPPDCEFGYCQWVAVDDGMGNPEWPDDPEDFCDEGAICGPGPVTPPDYVGEIFYVCCIGGP